MDLTPRKLFLSI